MNYLRSLELLKGNNKAIALMCLSFLVSLTLIRIDYSINTWQKDIYNIFQTYDVRAFYPAIATFLLLVIMQTTAMGINIYLTEYTEAIIRLKLMERLFILYVSLGECKLASDYPVDQRIAEDTDIYSTRAVVITVGMSAELIKAFVFYIVLINAAPHVVYSIEFVNAPLYLIMGTVSIIYFVIAWLATTIGGKNLLNYETDKRGVEAELRAYLFRIKESYSTFCHNSDKYHKINLVNGTIVSLTSKALRIARIAVFVTWSNSFMASLSMLVPIALLSPAYFHHEIMLGDIVQTSAAFAIFQSSLSRVIHSYREVTRMLAAFNRIHEFIDMVSLDTVADGRM